MKDNEKHIFSNLFDKVLYMFRTCPLPIIRSISTLYTQQQVSVMLVLLASVSVRYYYDSLEVSLCGGRMYSLYVDATVLLAR